MARVVHKQAKMLSGQTASTEIEVMGEWLCGVFLPAAVTGTISLSAKNKLTGTFAKIADITFTASTYLPLTYTNYLGVDAVRLDATLAQGADREFVLATRIEE